MPAEERARRCARRAPAPTEAEREPGGGASGRLAPEIIQRPVRERHDCFAACLADASPGAQGTVVVSFKISPAGAVSGASVRQSEIDDPVFLACVLDEYRAIEFPGPSREVTVVYPLRFE